jgi:hypothetical protein
MRSVVLVAAKMILGSGAGLREYLNEKYEPPGLGSGLPIEAVAAYLKDYAAHSRSKGFLFATAAAGLCRSGGGLPAVLLRGGASPRGG